MKFLAITASLVSIAFIVINAADVTYSVIAFPGSGDTVAVNIGEQYYPLQRNPMQSNVFTGVAPYGAEYRYMIVGASGQQVEDTIRRLPESTTNTGNEFFGRSRTVYNIPSLPRAFNYIYPALENDMNRDNEISTIIINADMNAINAILDTPEEDHEYAQVYNMSYISHDVIYNFEGAGIKNSGQSSKEKAKQSLKIKLSKFNTLTNDTIFGRQSFKLRAEANEPTMVREKLMMDSLAAAGAATLRGNWVRLFANNEPFGLFLMIDDSYSSFTDNFLNGGNAMSTTGVTIKGNAMNHVDEANLVYNGPTADNYNHDDVYILEDKGNDPNITKENYMNPLIDFMDRLSKTVIGSDAQTPGTITDLMDSADHTMIQMAMSFLAGSWDGFWYQASNFYLHQNIDTKKWYLITYDFDQTFGNGVEDPKSMTTPYQSYSRPDSQRPLVDVFIKSPYYEPKFQDIIKTIVKRFFNPRVIKPRLEALTDMLKEDIIWDRSLPFRSPGEKEVFSVDDLSNMFTTIHYRIGILEWVSNRTSSVCQQLNFNDTDDLPALPNPTA